MNLLISVGVFAGVTIGVMALSNRVAFLRRLVGTDARAAPSA